MTSKTASTLFRDARSRYGSLSPELRDALVYGLSAIFALLTILISSIPLYRQWGKIAIGAYIAGTLWCIGVALYHKISNTDDSFEDAVGDIEYGQSSQRQRSWKRGWSRPRVAVMGIVMCGSTLLPLALESYWQYNPAAYSTTTKHAQPEVLVVDRAGQNMLKGHDPYTVTSAKQVSDHPQVPAGQPSYDAFFPYLPAMAIFGMGSGTKLPGPLGNARVMFLLFTIAAVLLALYINGVADDDSVLGLQAMLVLPSAALPLSTGGDDIPVIALMLLGLVLMKKHKLLPAGIVLGMAASLKFTSWPLVMLALLVIYAAFSLKDTLKAVAGAGIIIIPSVVPVAMANIRAFVVNVILYPLGLAGIRSPAASPMPGHILTSTMPSIHHTYSLVIVLAGGVVFLAALKRWFPRNSSSLASFVGWAFVVAVMLAPATRFGYLVYPFDLIIWSKVLQPESIDLPPIRALPSATSSQVPAAV